MCKKGGMIKSYILLLETKTDCGSFKKIIVLNLDGRWTYNIIGDLRDVNNSNTPIFAIFFGAHVSPKN